MKKITPSSPTPKKRAAAKKAPRRSRDAAVSTALPRGAKKRLDALCEEASRARGKNAKLEVLARFAVGGLADLCVIHTAKRGGGLKLLLWIQCDPSLVVLKRASAGRSLVRPDHPVHDVYRTGKPIFVPRVDHDLIRRVAHDDAHHHILKSTGLSSCMFLPIAVGGETIGTVSLAKFGESRTFAAKDLALAEAGVAVVAAGLVRA